MIAVNVDGWWKDATTPMSAHSRAATEAAASSEAIRALRWSLKRARLLRSQRGLAYRARSYWIKAFTVR